MFAGSSYGKTIWVTSISFSNSRPQWMCADKSSCAGQDSWRTCRTVTGKTTLAAWSQLDRHFFIRMVQSEAGTTTKYRVSPEQSINQRKSCNKCCVVARCKSIHIKGEQCRLSRYTVMRFTSFKRTRTCLSFTVLLSWKRKKYRCLHHLNSRVKLNKHH